MPFAFLPDLRLHYRDEGPKNVPALVLVHALGLDLTIWDQLCALLPANLRVIRYDLRGHGQSDVPSGPYAMGAMVRDAERLLEHLNVKDVAFCGLSIGGLVAQGIAVKRLDLVRSLILSNTAARIGHESLWEKRIEDARTQGHEAMVQASLERWFPRQDLTQAHIQQIADILRRTSPEGYIASMEAIRGTDFYTPTSGLRLPTLGIGSVNDASTPPDLVRETTELVPGSEFTLIRRAGHLPCVDQPETYARILTDFLTATGHLK
ncbi:3-oxoadipate enol-lactonase [Donghicola sp. C2-DW-16]|uniref:3-oxoadipate enol-lactonase n=1 Tax=Donghicola mangrovi TaxID=2729614 RepID=A0ABX2PJF0_9RHOB|nr:3-oxoadipate enol-lactonase [Donghicola mangrovi]NVO29219.1 3-oxoadipate enol-lactonase [Donghicola mangrovi]